MSWLRALLSATRGFRSSDAARINPLFDIAYYSQRYPESTSYPGGPYEHYKDIGIRERCDPNEYFDTGWYLRRYPDVEKSGRNPLDHYLEFGRSEGRDPSILFSTDLYVYFYQDLRQSRINPLLHFLSSGRDEGRQAIPVFILPTSAITGRPFLPSEKQISVSREKLDEIDAAPKSGGDWPDRMLYWSSLLCDMKEKERVSDPISLIQIYSENKEKSSEDFFPSAQVIYIVKVGLEQHVALLSAKHDLSDIGQESWITSIGIMQVAQGGDQRKQLSDKYETEFERPSDIDLWARNALSVLNSHDSFRKLGRDISRRLWREIYMQAGRLSAKEKAEEKISDAEKFTFEWLFRLQPHFPLNIMDKPAFFTMLYHDLLFFVARNAGVHEDWGSIINEGNDLILRSRPKVAPLPRLRATKTRERLKI